MTINEAILVLSDSAYKHTTNLGQYFYEAEKLGIEALRMVKASRESGGRLTGWLVPGETESNPSNVLALFHGETKE